MPPSHWDTHQLEAKIIKILDVKSRHRYHSRRPFMTPYQIAIRLDEQQHDVVESIGTPIGGEGTGQHNSLAQYIARELSKRIKNGTISNVGIAFLYSGNLKTLEYKHGSRTIKNSLGKSWNLSMYRLVD